MTSARTDSWSLVPQSGVRRKSIVETLCLPRPRRYTLVVEQPDRNTEREYGFMRQRVAHMLGTVLLLRRVSPLACTRSVGKVICTTAKQRYRKQGCALATFSRGCIMSGGAAHGHQYCCEISTAKHYDPFANASFQSHPLRITGTLLMVADKWLNTDAALRKMGEGDEAKTCCSTGSNAAGTSVISSDNFSSQNNLHFTQGWVRNLVLACTQT